MEEQLKNPDARTTTIEQILPALATKEDLRLTKEDLRRDILATKDELRPMTEALRRQLRAGFEDAKRHAVMLEEATWGEIRLLRGEMITMNGELRGEMAAMRDDLRGEMAATKTDLRDDIRALSKQISALRAPRRKER